MSFWKDPAGATRAYVNPRMPGVRKAAVTTAATMAGGVIPGALAYGAMNKAENDKKRAAQQGSADGSMDLGERPQMTPWVAMNQEDVRATDLFRPTTITGSEVQKQMEESPWYKMALEKQGAEQARLMDQAARQQAGSLAGARTQLAMRGGLRGGTAERLAMAGSENLANLMQQQRMAGAIERGQLGMQGADLASRLAQLNAQTMTDAQARNIYAGMGELDKQRAYNLAKYQEEMKGYAAEKTGQALGKEPKPGLFSDPIGYFGKYFEF